VHTNFPELCQELKILVLNIAGSNTCYVKILDITDAPSISVVNCTGCYVTEVLVQKLVSFSVLNILPCSGGAC
jgi:hypothetical protein